MSEFVGENSAHIRAFAGHRPAAAAAAAAAGYNMRVQSGECPAAPYNTWAGVADWVGKRRLS